MQNSSNSQINLPLWPRIRRFLITFLIILEILLMTGGYGKDGRIYRWIGQYIAQFMEWMVKIFNSSNGVGFAIIILTAVIRLILLPIMVGQQRQATIQAEKMSMLQPQLKKVQEGIKNTKDPQEQLALQQAQMQLYKEHDVSLFGSINFLSMLIQLPIIQGLYVAIQQSNVVKGAHFFGTQLDRPVLAIAIVAGVFYILQSYISLLNAPEETRKQMSTMIWLSPVMIFVVALLQSGALGLYFAVGGIFVLLQTLYIYLIRPKLQAKVHEEFVVNDIIDKLIDDAKNGRLVPTGAFGAALNAASSTQAEMQNSMAAEQEEMKTMEADSQTSTTEKIETPIKKGNRNAGKQKGHK